MRTPLNPNKVELNNHTETRERITVVPDSLLRTQAYVNGQWIAAASGKTFAVHNPATGALIATVPDMSRADVRQAIDAAYAAWPAYRDLTAGA